MSLEVSSETLKARPHSQFALLWFMYKAEVVSSRLPIPVAIPAACDHDGLLTLEIHKSK